MLAQDNTIYVFFMEYEILKLVTLDKQKCVDAVKEHGGLWGGDYVDIWKDDKSIKYYVNYDEFISDCEVKPK